LLLPPFRNNKRIAVGCHLLKNGENCQYNRYNTCFKELFKLNNCIKITQFEVKKTKYLEDLFSDSSLPAIRFLELMEGSGDPPEV